MSGPLSGIRVVDFTHVLAGPACSYFLGLLGAEVIKVESIDKGDAMRHRGGTSPERAAEGMSTAYLTQGGGKQSIALDLESVSGKDIFTELLKGADVLVENHLPKMMQRVGFDETRSLQINPRLIHCAITGYGRGGDRENAPAYDVNIQAACGIMTLTGTADTGPLRTGAPIMDYGVALAASFAISAALHHRNQTSKGTFIDVSMLETAFTLMSSTITDYFATGNEPKPRGNAANSRSPGAGNFPCKEGILSLGVNEESQFWNLASVLGRDDWRDDPRFADRAARKVNEKTLEKDISSALLTRSADEWEPDMLAGGVPAAKLRTLPESLALAQVAARSFLHEDDLAGTKMPTLPFRIGGVSAHRPKTSPPRHGVDTACILSAIEQMPAEGKQHMSETKTVARLETPRSDPPN